MSAHAILTPEAHGTLRVRTDRHADLGDRVMCCLAMPAEFRQLQNEFPILFRHNQERDDFTALAMFGFEADENLFLNDDEWGARLLPLAMEIQPFLIGGDDEAGTRQVHVDMASPRIDEVDGVRVFDEDGRPTPYLEFIAERLGALDEAYRGSSDFYAALRRYDLLEPLTLDVTLDDGSTNRLVGFHVIDEDRLRNLDVVAIGDLHAGGHLTPIFMALASLANLGALIARKNRRQAGG